VANIYELLYFVPGPGLGSRDIISQEVQLSGSLEKRDGNYFFLQAAKTRRHGV